MNRPPEQISLFNANPRSRVGPDRAPAPPKPSEEFNPHGPQLPMFMTPREIKTHFSPLSGDREHIGMPSRLETDEEVWERKGRESRMSGLTGTLHREGVRDPVQLQVGSGRQVLGGHHRIAAAKQDSPIPVIFHPDADTAMTDLQHPYERDMYDRDPEGYKKLVRNVFGSSGRSA